MKASRKKCQTWSLQRLEFPSHRCFKSQPLRESGCCAMTPKKHSSTHSSRNSQTKSSKVLLVQLKDGFQKSCFSLVKNGLKNLGPSGSNHASGIHYWTPWEVLALSLARQKTSCFCRKLMVFGSKKPKKNIQKVKDVGPHSSRFRDLLGPAPGMSWRRRKRLEGRILWGAVEVWKPGSSKYGFHCHQIP